MIAILILLIVFLILLALVLAPGLTTKGTDEQQALEDAAQMQYLKQWSEKHK